MKSTEDKKNPIFISLEEAAEMKTGTRITFVPGVQALYAEALKNICFVKQIPITRVLHPLMGTDKETGEDRQANLYNLTKQTSLPTMLHEEERPRNVWIEQLALADEDYITHLKGLREAEKQYLQLEYKMDQQKLICQLWQTVSANRRQSV